MMDVIFNDSSHFISKDWISGIRFAKVFVWRGSVTFLSYIILILMDHIPSSGLSDGFFFLLLYKRCVGIDDNNFRCLHFSTKRVTHWSCRSLCKFAWCPVPIIHAFAGRIWMWGNSNSTLVPLYIVSGYNYTPIFLIRTAAAPSEPNIL